MHLPKGALFANHPLVVEGIQSELYWFWKCGKCYKEISEGVEVELNPELFSSKVLLIMEGLISKLNHSTKNVFALQNQISYTIYVPCSCYFYRSSSIPAVDVSSSVSCSFRVEMFHTQLYGYQQPKLVSRFL